MTTQTRPHSLRALVIALLVVFAAFSGTVTLSGVAAAAANSETLTVTDDPTQPDGTITVEGNIDSVDSGDDVTFLIQDPSDTDVDTVSKDVDSTDFSVEIDLGNLDFGDGLDPGTATIMADEGSEFVEPEASTTFVVDDEYPTVSIESPPDGAENTSQPTISGTASDDVELERVQVAISDSSGDYYDGSSFSSDSAVWLPVSGTSDWSYDTDANGITSQGEYEVAVRVEDAAGHVRSYDGGPPTPVSNTQPISYTVDDEAPDISSPSVTDGGDDIVTVGDTVTVSATVTDSMSGVQSVEVDASPLGGSESLPLTADSDDSYERTFTVSEPNVSDGSVSLTINATDEFGQNATATDSITLETSVASADNLTVHRDFVGIVENDDTSVRVTAEDVEDAYNNSISDGTATLDIRGATYELDVLNGEIDDSIDPTSIPDDAETGTATASIVEADADDNVTLVHEAESLDEGYQVHGTPMDASDVVFENVSDVITYDPTDSDMPWVAPSEEQAGEGYYVYGNASDARIGYTYADNGELHSEYLHEGYNLVAATPDLNDDDTVPLDSDLGSTLNTGDTGIDVYVRDPTIDLDEPSGTTDATAFTDDVDGTDTVGDPETDPDSDPEGYEGYFVYVEPGTGEVVRIVDGDDYEPSEGS